MGLVANQVCSLEGGGEHTNPAKLFEMLEFPTSPPVNSTTRPPWGRHRDGWKSAPRSGDFIIKMGRAVGTEPIDMARLARWYFS